MLFPIFVREYSYLFLRLVTKGVPHTAFHPDALNAIDEATHMLRADSLNSTLSVVKSATSSG